MVADQGAVAQAEALLPRRQPAGLGVAAHQTEVPAGVATVGDRRAGEQRLGLGQGAERVVDERQCRLGVPPFQGCVGFGTIVARLPPRCDPGVGGHGDRAPARRRPGVVVRVRGGEEERITLGERGRTIADELQVFGGQTAHPVPLHPEVEDKGPPLGPVGRGPVAGHRSADEPGQEGVRAVDEHLARPVAATVRFRRLDGAAADHEPHHPLAGVQVAAALAHRPAELLGHRADAAVDAAGVLPGQVQGERGEQGVGPLRGGLGGDEQLGVEEAAEGGVPGQPVAGQPGRGRGRGQAQQPAAHRGRQSPDQGGQLAGAALAVLVEQQGGQRPEIVGHLGLLPPERAARRKGAHQRVPPGGERHRQVALAVLPGHLERVGRPGERQPLGQPVERAAGLEAGADGGARVKAEAAVSEGRGAAAGLVVLLEHEHAAAGVGEQGSGRQPADTSADDEHIVLVHGAGSGQGTMGGQDPIPVPCARRRAG